MRPSGWAVAAGRLWPRPAYQDPPAAAVAAAATGLVPPDVAWATFPVPAAQPPSDLLGITWRTWPLKGYSSWLGLSIQDVGSTYWAAGLPDCSHEGTNLRVVRVSCAPLPVLSLSPYHQAYPCPPEKPSLQIKFTDCTATSWASCVWGGIQGTCVVGAGGLCVCL